MNIAIDWFQLFSLALFNSLLIIGLYKSTDFEYCHSDELECDWCDEDGIDKGSKNVLYKLRLWSIQSLGDFWSKPFFTCIRCMASVHSLYVYWLFMPFNTGALLFYPLYILFLSGLNTLMSKVID